MFDFFYKIPFLICLESVYCFISFYNTTKIRKNNFLIIPHLFIHPGLIVVFGNYLSNIFGRYMFWITYVILDTLSYS